MGGIGHHKLDGERQSNGVEVVVFDEVEESIQRVAPQTVRSVRLRFKAKVTDAFQNERLS